MGGVGVLAADAGRDVGFSVVGGLGDLTADAGLEEGFSVVWGVGDFMPLAVASDTASGMGEAAFADVG